MFGITLIKTVNGIDRQIHTFRDWGLIPKTRFNVSPAVPKTTYVELQGSDAIIDLTESLTGYVCYKMRRCEITFSIVGRRNAWSSLYSLIQNYIQGEKLKVLSDEDPSWYWVGRFYVSDWDTVQKTAEITISGDVEPYKISTEQTNDDWIWDTFNFELGVIRNYSFVIWCEGVTRVKVIGSKKHVVPIFEYTNGTVGEGNIYLMKSDDVADGQELLTEGDNRFPDIVIGEGEHYFYFNLVPDDNYYQATIDIKFDVGSL